MVFSILNKWTAMFVIFFVLLKWTQGSFAAGEEMDEGTHAKNIRTSVEDLEGGLPHLRRNKRHLFQLGVLVTALTEYDIFKFLNYGNWCGIGSDRKNDGSVIDGCDECCKVHDICYNTTEHDPSYIVTPVKIGNASSEEDITPPPCIPHTQQYHITNFTTDTARCVDKIATATKIADVNAAKCALAACTCDLNLALCLRKKPCKAF